MVAYLTKDIARTPQGSLSFSSDPKSQRALAGSRVTYDPDVAHVERDTLFQIVFLENVSHSIQDQYDELMSSYDVEGVGADRLKYTRQRVVRQINVEGDEQGNPQEQEVKQGNTINNSNATFKLTLQDTSGNVAYGIELGKLSFLSGKNFSSGFPIQLGTKLLVKAGTKLFKGVLLLNQDNVEFLGGLVPEWNQDLQQKHMTYLKKRIEAVDMDG